MANFNKETYMSGDDVNIEVEASVPTGHNDPNTYSLTVCPGFSCGGGANIIHKDIGSSSTFDWTIPNDFNGWLTFYIQVYNEDGDYGETTKTENIMYGIITVNANPNEYSAGNTITVAYTLTSNVLSSPDYYYTVLDAGWNAVEADTASGGSFTFAVPDTPSSQYRFYVYASEGGVTLSGSDSSKLIQGYFISINFDREIYSRGDTMKITYQVIARGDSALPDYFTISYGLVNGPTETYQTTAASGEFTYKIPSSGMDEGTLIFQANDGITGASTTEVITVRGGNPLWWAKLAEIPAFSIILLILIIILFILYFRMRRGAAPMRGSPAEAPATAPPPVAPGGTPPPPGAGPGTETAAEGGTALSVPCKSCGAPIELTTSKRPIEVMCPS
jgi:hypothetical protein